MADQGVWDVSLYGESLKAWREWVKTLESNERLTYFAIRANKIYITVSMPLWLIAQLIRLPLMLLDTLTMFLLGGPFRYLSLIFTTLGLASSGLWTKKGIARPLLLILQPILTPISMFLISLTPEEPDMHDTKSILCELWPLSQPRLNWLKERGSGRAEVESAITEVLPTTAP